MKKVEGESQDRKGEKEEGNKEGREEGNDSQEGKKRHFYHVTSNQGRIFSPEDFNTLSLLSHHPERESMIAIRPAIPKGNGIIARVQTKCDLPHMTGHTFCALISEQSQDIFSQEEGGKAKAFDT